MKVLLLSDRLDAGGAETHLAQLARGLTRMGVEIVLLSGGGRVARELEAEGFRHIFMPLPTHSPFRLLAIRRRIRTLLRKEKFDIVHAHTRLTALLLRGCGRSRAARVVTVHAHFRTDLLFSRLCYWGERTIAVGEDLRAYVCDAYGLPASRVQVIPNGIDCARFSPSDVSEPHAPHILFASRLDDDCAASAELLCRIAPALNRRFPRVIVSFAGGGSAFPRLAEQCRQINRTLGREMLCALGHVSDMPSLMRSSDIFVGVSRAAMEAASCGCAVVLCGNEGYFGRLEEISLESASLTNFCARGCTGADESALLSDLTVFLCDADLRRRAGDAGRAWMLAHADGTQMCRDTLALYRRASEEKRSKAGDVVIGGYFGCGNMGDDAILSGLLEGLRAAAPSLRPIVLTGEPRRDSRRFGVICVNRKNPISVIRVFLRASVFVYGGGSLLQNITGKRSLWYYLFLLRLSRALGCQTAFCGGGIGPLIGTRAKRSTARVLSGCRYVSLRDRRSYAVLREWGIPSARLHRGADLALLLPPPPESRARALCREAGIGAGERLLGVVLCGGARCRETRHALLLALHGICKSERLTPLFLIFDHVCDTEETQAAQMLLGGRIARCREPSDAAAWFSSCEAAVSMRLHGLVLASSVGIPTLGVPPDGRDEKLPAFAKQAGQAALFPDGSDVQSLTAALKKTLSRTPQGAFLCDSVAEMRKKAQKDLANLCEMIYNNKKQPHKATLKGTTHEKRTACRSSAPRRF